MVSKKTILGNLIGLGFLLTVIPISAATPPFLKEVTGERSHGVFAQRELPIHASSEKRVQFPRIHQPLALKVAVTLGGLGLIGLELWWFLFSKTKAQAANEPSKSR